LSKLERFVSRFKILPFDEAAAKNAGQIQATLRKSGIPIGVYDIQIAAIALSYNLTLVTHNTREFRRINGLAYEDWEIVP
jgi:tRNA(fMet)-specific endonuclease VapC